MGTNCPNCNAHLELGITAYAPPGDPKPNVIGGGQTRIVDVGEQGPYSGTGRDTTIVMMADHAIERLAPATSVNKRTGVSHVVAFEVELKPGAFRAGLGEYGDAGNFASDLALSRTPFEIEGAPARALKHIAGVTIGDDPRAVFGPGTWYVNVRVNDAGNGGPTQGWTLSYYNP